MPATTNRLVAICRNFQLAPRFSIALAAALALGSLLATGAGRVRAAAIAGGSPLDDSSVAALTSLDKAMESVTSRVTPSIVNVAVTARPGEHESIALRREPRAEGQDQDEPDAGMPNPPKDLPRGFSQFFGPSFRMMPQEPQFERGIGSGVILSPDGYIVTNDHVVADATNIKVTLNDRRVLPAKVVGTDPLTDIAVIKVEASGLAAIAWGDSTALHPGQTVLAFGSPFGALQFSVTRGIISALGRPNPFATDARAPGAYIQTDAAINPGNSGGALVNAHGELVGINVGIMTSSGSFAGAGFAIPAQIVRATTTQLIAHGSVDHGFLGISMNDVTPANASFFDLKDAEGAIVAEVTADSPASRGGVRQGDVIRQLNGERIASGSALQVAVSQMTPGTRIELGVLRQGKPEKLQLTIGSYHRREQAAEQDPANSSEDKSAARSGRLGLGVADLSDTLRRQIQAPAGVRGAVVESVRPGSAAEDAGLQPGDVIEEVDRKPTQTATSFAAEVRALPAGREILLLVWSRGNSGYRTVTPADGKPGA